MPTAHAIAAALNNAVWCDAVCRAAGGTTQFAEDLWRSSAPSPSYFPNVITLDSRAKLAAVEAALRACASSSAELGVKDSFRTLELLPIGFSKLFDASWIWKDAAHPLQTAWRLTWKEIESVEDLRAWESAWWPGPASAEPRARVFAAALLREANITFLAGFHGAALVTGAAITETEGLVGLTCAFFRGTEAAEARPELLEVVAARFPGKAIAGYESGGELRAMRDCGFREVGPLSVWLGRAASPPR